MRYKLPPLNALRAFDAAARCGSISAAARELGVTPGAVSRHLAVLEDYFGCVLAVRGAQGVALSERAAAFHASLSGAFQTIDTAARSLAGSDAVRQAVKLRLYPTFTTEWLAGRLSAFALAHPNIELQVATAPQAADAALEHFDLAVTAQPPRQPGFVAQHLYRPLYSPVCSVHSLGAASLPILYADRERSMWHAWFEAHGDGVPDFERGIRLDNLALTYQTARQGAGLALGLLFYIIDDVLAGRLCIPVARTIDYGNLFYLVASEARLADDRVRIVHGWILAEAAATNDRIDRWQQQASTAPEQRYRDDPLAS